MFWEPKDGTAEVPLPAARRVGAEGGAAEEEPWLLQNEELGLGRRRGSDRTRSQR